MNGFVKISFFLQAFLFVTYAANAQFVEYESFKKKEIGEVAEAYSVIVRENDSDPGVQSFVERIDLINNVAEMILDGFEASKSTSLADMFDDITDGLEEINVANEDHYVSMISALEIISEYGPYFNQSLISPSIPAQKVDTLRHYYRRLVEVAQHYVATKGRLVAGISAESEVDVLQLSLVLYYLHIPDDQFGQSHIEGFPDWMRESNRLLIMERFSFRMRRTHSAYQLFLASLNLTQKDKHYSYQTYLQNKVDQLMAERDYHSVVYCLRALIEGSENDSEASATELRLKLASLYAETGHPKLSVKAIDPILAYEKDDGLYAKASMLRLKYLYESKQYNVVLESVSSHIDDARCHAYRPQIVYIAWVSARRQDDAEYADKLHKVFLEDYPEHPLGADLYFASAMTALAKSEYSQAMKLLEVIEYRYPDARIMKKVKDIQERLEKTMGELHMSE